MHFEHLHRVRFHQSDPAGVLFFGRVFELVESTYEELCRAAGIDIDALLKQHVYTTPIVHAEADYHAPIVVGEEVTIQALVDRIGKSSIHLVYRIVGPSGDLRVTVRVVHVHVDARTWDTAPIPDDMRTRLEQFSGSK